MCRLCVVDCVLQYVLQYVLQCTLQCILQYIVVAAAGKALALCSTHRTARGRPRDRASVRCVSVCTLFVKVFLCSTVCSNLLAVLALARSLRFSQPFEAVPCCSRTQHTQHTQHTQRTNTLYIAIHRSRLRRVPPDVLHSQLHISRVLTNVALYKCPRTGCSNRCSPIASRICNHFQFARHRSLSRPI